MQIQVTVRYFGSHVLLWAAILLLLNLGYNPLVEHIFINAQEPIQNLLWLHPKLGLDGPAYQFISHFIPFKCSLPELNTPMHLRETLKRKKRVWEVNEDKHAWQLITNTTKELLLRKPANLPHIPWVGEPFRDGGPLIATATNELYTRGFWSGSQWRRLYARPSSLTRHDL